MSSPGARVPGATIDSVGSAPRAPLVTSDQSPKPCSPDGTQAGPTDATRSSQPEPPAKRELQLPARNWLTCALTLDEPAAKLGRTDSKVARGATDNSVVSASQEVNLLNFATRRDPPRRGHLSMFRPGPTNVYIGRGERWIDPWIQPSMWANPWKISSGREDSIAKFQRYFASNTVLRNMVGSLANCTLYCGCASESPCHADVLISQFSSVSSQSIQTESWQVPQHWCTVLDAMVRSEAWPPQRRSHVEGKGACLGLSFGQNGPIVAEGPPSWQTLCQAALSIVCHTCHDTSLRFTSLQVNVDSVSSPHVDQNNFGASYMLCIGDFAGGEFVCNGTEHTARNMLLRFDGSLTPSNRPFSGKRISLVLFRHSCVRNIPPWDRERIWNIGLWRPPLPLDCLHCQHRAHQPWDILKDPTLDVLVREDEVKAIARASDGQHWGPNCATFSASRGIPMPDGSKAPNPYEVLTIPRVCPVRCICREFMMTPAWRTSQPSSVLKASCQVGPLAWNTRAVPLPGSCHLGSH